MRKVLAMLVVGVVFGLGTVGCNPEPPKANKAPVGNKAPMDNKAAENAAPAANKAP